MITRIHVNRHVIHKNKIKQNQGEPVDPPLVVIQRGRRHYAHRVRIDGPSVMLYRPSAPLACGATAWIETQAAVIIEDEA